jgi:hypothetical protein
MSTPSEQENELELGHEPELENPRDWQAQDPDRAGYDDRPAEQLVAPDEDGEFGDDEPTEIAEDAGPSSTAGPEAQAMRIVDEP